MDKPNMINLIRGDGIYKCPLCTYSTRFTYNSKVALVEKSESIGIKHMEATHGLCSRCKGTGMEPDTGQEYPIGNCPECEGIGYI